MSGKKVFTSIITAALAFSACAFNAEKYAESKAESFNRKIQIVAIELANRLREFETTDKSIAVTTFVDLDNLGDSSSFGRFVAEQISTELYKLGFRVRELRQMNEVEMVENKGEFILSRKADKLLRKYSIDAVVTGTYTLVGDEVVVNARLLSIDTARVISVGQMVANVRMQSFIGDLLNRGSGKATPVVKVYAPEDKGT